MRTVLVQQQIPSSAKMACPAPVTLPDRDLSQSEAQTFWGTDRTSLRICEARRAAAVGGARVQ